MTNLSRRQVVANESFVLSRPGGILARAANAALTGDFEMSQTSCQSEG